MEVCRRSSWLKLILLNLLLFSTILQGVQGEESGVPSESECRPHIEKALKQFEAVENEHALHVDNSDSNEDLPTVEITTDESFKLDDHAETYTESNEIEQMEENQFDDNDENDDDDNKIDDYNDDDDNKIDDDNDDDDNKIDDDNDDDDNDETLTNSDNIEDADDNNESEEQNTDDLQTQDEQIAENLNENDDIDEPLELEQNDEQMHAENLSEEKIPDDISSEDNNENKSIESEENNVNDEDVYNTSTEQNDEPNLIDDEEENETEDVEIQQDNDDTMDDQADIQQEIEEDVQNEDVIETEAEESNDGNQPESDENADAVETTNILLQESISVVSRNTDKEEEEGDLAMHASDSNNSEEQSPIEVNEEKKLHANEVEDVKDETKIDSDEQNEEEPLVEELAKSKEEDPEKLRPRDHITQLLKFDSESEEVENVSEKSSEIVLKELKKLYENAIKPLETLYKYRDLSNRHFGDSEIFSKPLILFMGPWSGGKSTIINYLLDIEHSDLNLHTGAEPSPAYFNILMYGQEPEILDGTELAADYTFSGLQKFGQGLEERLRGYKFPSKLLEKVNIVEIPGILEVRKQVSRIFPFNDACQWFIDRADIIFLVYDPSKLDVGPETEAILDQLKGREHQTRIVLNKADQVKPEELMRVQGALIWNISPLMSSAQPPVMYTTSLWCQPYEQWAPVRLLQAQERAFLRDLRSAIDKRIDNKIASARRFAVRVRNHAKMVDCYLTTYYNHKSVFGNRKQVSDEIINHPQDYHIYEGLSTLTNISRYDLPDPDVYKDFFRLNALYDFQKLSSTCTYFRGCPINRLDVAIAYDLPELVGKHKRLIEAALSETPTTKTPSGS